MNELDSPDMPKIEVKQAGFSPRKEEKPRFVSWPRPQASHLSLVSFSFYSCEVGKNFVIFVLLLLQRKLKNRDFNAPTIVSPSYEFAWSFILTLSSYGRSPLQGH